MTKAVNLAQQVASGVSLGFKNKIINGAMVIDQRNAGASYTPTGNQYTLDQWRCRNSLGVNKFNIQQNAGSVTPPSGFTKYLGVTSTSAYTVLNGDYFALQNQIEGFNVSDLNWGTANAQAVTLSFQVYSSLTGTFGGSLTNGAFNRSYPFTYSVPVANTWTTIIITVAGDTTGTWATNNSTGLSIWFGLGVGSTYNGTAGSWAAAGYISCTGATSVVGTNGATFYITGVQLEVGTTATNFEYRDYGRELIMCQRYYQRTTADGVYTTFITGMACSGATSGNGAFILAYPMRVTPTLDSSAASTFQYNDGTAGFVCTSIGLASSQSNTRMAHINFNSSGMTQYRTYTLSASNTTSAYLGFSAEL